MHKVLFVCHFYKKQMSKLFQIIPVTYTYITEGIAEGPDF